MAVRNRMGKFKVGLRFKRERGFTLAEIAIAFFVLALLLAVLLPASQTALSNSRRSATTQKLATIETALINFVMVNKRLPCPSDGTSITGSEGARDGSGDCTTQANGVVPWLAIGLSLQDVLDAWNNQITYRVGYGLTRSESMNMSYCDPAGTGYTTTGATPLGPNVNLGLCNSVTCTGTFTAANCTSPQNFLKYKGLDVQSMPSAPSKIMDYSNYTSAAFILISHGDNQYGAINNNGKPITTALSGVIGTTLEDPNVNGASLVVTSGAPPVFIDATFSDTSNPALYFDDIIVRPLLFSVITRAQLGPRSH